MTAVSKAVTLRDMATPKLTPEETARVLEKARIVAEVAEWLAFDWDDCPDKEEAATAINKAFDALQLHSEPVLRNEVLASVKRWATDAHIKSCEAFDQAHPGKGYLVVQSAIEAALGSKTYGIKPAGKVSPATIKEALESGRAPDSERWWRAAVELLVETGFTRVSPEALRMDSKRRAKPR